MSDETKEAMTLKDWVDEQLVNATGERRAVLEDVNHLLQDEPDRLAAKDAEITQLRRLYGFNIEETEDGCLKVCRRDHEDHEDCNWVKYVPEARVAEKDAEIERLKQDVQKAKNEATIARNDLDLAGRCAVILNGAIDTAKEKAEFWQQRIAIVRQRKDRRITDLESERDELKAEHTKLMCEYQDTTRELYALKRRIEAEEKGK